MHTSYLDHLPSETNNFAMQQNRILYPKPKPAVLQALPLSTAHKSAISKRKNASRACEPCQKARVKVQRPYYPVTALSSALSCLCRVRSLQPPLIPDHSAKVDHHADVASSAISYVT